MRHILHIIILWAVVAVTGMAQTIGEAFYIYRNDGQFNAFFLDEVQSIEYSHYDADSVYYEENVTQLVYTADSLYRIPLAAIDSVAFHVNDITVSKDYLPVNEDEYTIVSADIEAGQYVLEFNGGVPDIEEGRVMTIIDDTISEVIRVQSVLHSGQRVNIMAERASLGDIFTSGSFTLSTEQMATSRQTESFNGNNRQVFYPIEVTYFDEREQRHKISRFAPHKVDFEQNLYSYTIDYSGHDFYKNDNMRFYLQTCRLDFNLDFIFSCNFNTFDEGLDKWNKGELAIQKSVIRGKVDTDFMLRFDASGKKVEELPDIMLKKNIHKPIWAKFIVAGVPIVVVMNTHLLAHGSYSVEGKFSAYAGFATSTSAEIGCSWSKAAGLKPYASFNNNFTLHDPTIEGDAHLEEKIGVFPRVTFSLYGLIGPTFDIKPYFRHTIDLGFYDNLNASTNRDYYGAEYNAYAGYDASIGLSYLSVLGKDPFVKSPAWNVSESHLYEAPKKIKFEKASQEYAIPSKPIEVSFRVTDFLYSWNQEVNAAFPMVVKFETNSGILSSDFSCVDIKTGLVKITWTPAGKSIDGKDPYLVAMMHNRNGRVITADRWTPAKIIVNVTTLDAYDITETSANMLGKVDTRGQDVLGNVYFYCGKNSNPKTYGTKINVGPVGKLSSPSFSAPLINLEPGTTYYFVAAYSDGTEETLGTVNSFKTKEKVFVETGDATNVTATTATVNGHYQSGNDGIDFGIIYGTSNNLSYTSANVVKAISSSDGYFSVDLSNLVENSTYYYRAYLIDDGTKYGEVKSFSTKSQQQLSCPDNHHPHMIDLGLPSGTKWACCNVGASTPEEYGNYYAWGETQPKSWYSGDTYQHLQNDRWVNIGYDIASTGYDAATANWGAAWRMPSKVQFQELINNTTSVWTTQNGVNGRKFTGSNGGTIFFPAAGLRWDDKQEYAGSDGFYWSSTLDESLPHGAYELRFYSGYVYCDCHYGGRTMGHSVRPVR